jgi:ketosteroid isomerase-like protein
MTLMHELSETAAQAFGQAWAGHWNRGDFEAVLAHFADDCVFESPLAEKHAGTTRLVGKEAVRSYWRAAIAAIGTVHFTVHFVAVATDARAITIVYQAELGPRRLHACERLIFGADGKVTSGMGLYGPPVVA